MIIVRLWLEYVKINLVDIIVGCEICDMVRIGLLIIGDVRRYVVKLGILLYYVE